MRRTMSMRVGCIAGLAAVLLVSAAELRADTVIMSEFAAANEAGLLDEDGEPRDWVELYNFGEESVDLTDWSLTDDPEEKEQWTFPAVTIGPRQFLIVFASDKDRRDPAGELHTNFKLGAKGEYLGLFRPDGQVANEFAPEYPVQVPFASYGVRMGETVTLASEGSPAKYFVPTDDSLGDGWTAPDFDDAAWVDTPTPLGFDTKRTPTYTEFLDEAAATALLTAMDDVNSSLYVRMEVDIADPSGLASLIMQARYDDGFGAYINGTLVAGRNMPEEGLAWDSRASATHRDSEGVIPEQVVLPPNAAAALVAGKNVIAIHGLNRSAGNSDFFLGIAMGGVAGADEIDLGQLQYFQSSSPGWANGTGLDSIAEAPAFSRESAAVTETFNLELTAAAGAEIRYTTDGSDPHALSTLYTGPVEIASTAVVKARAYEAGKLPSPIVTESFMRLDENVVDVESTLPLVLINTFGVRPQNNGQWVSAQMVIIERGENGKTKITDTPQYLGGGAVKVRGSSTGGRQKFSLSVEIRDEEGEDLDVEVLGLPEESDYVLYGAYNFDRALIRNALIYELSNQAGRYATRTRFCEVYLNQGNGNLSTSSYYGIYSFGEKIKRGNDRVDIARLDADDLEEPDISGGYMLKIDRLDPGDQGLSAGGFRLGWVYPKELDMRRRPEQSQWVASYINRMVASLNGPNYEEFIDVDGWIDHHILNVLPNNVDALRLSTYMHKDREGKWVFGPIWDFDRSMNSTDGRDDNPRAWNGTGDATRFFEYPWWVNLFRQDEFMRRYQRRWKELRQEGQPLSTSNVDAVIDGMAAEIREAHPREATRWRQTSHAGWETEIRNLKNWLRIRSEWIDAQFIIAPEFSHDGGLVEPGLEVTLEAPEGEIYYTIDGFTDPQRSSTRPAEAAILYEGPIVISKTTHIKARALTSGGWSDVVTKTFLTGPVTLAVSEIMYHPREPDPDSIFNKTDFEFLEIYNYGADPISLAAVTFQNSRPISVDFSELEDATLGPGQYLVISNDDRAFNSRYPDFPADALLLQADRGNLRDSGEAIQLYLWDAPVADFTYDDEWHPTTDGAGFSLVPVEVGAAGVDLSDGANWRPSMGQ